MIESGVKIDGRNIQLGTKIQVRVKWVMSSVTIEQKISMMHAKKKGCFDAQLISSMLHWTEAYPTHYNAPNIITTLAGVDCS